MYERCDDERQRYGDQYERYEERFEEPQPLYEQPRYEQPQGRYDDPYGRNDDQYERFEGRHERRSPGMGMPRNMSDDFQRMVSTEPVYVPPPPNININIGATGGVGAPGGYQQPPPPHMPSQSPRYSEYETHTRPRDEYDYEFSAKMESDSRRGERGYAPPHAASYPAPAAHSYESSYGRTGRGGSHCERPSSAHSYSQVAEIAVAHSSSPNPSLHQQYREAAHGVQESYKTHTSCEFSEEKYASHFDAHSEAYGSENKHRPMASDAIGAAAAIEALKITATNNQSCGRVQQGGGRPQGGFGSMETHASSGNTHQPVIMGGRPSGGKLQGRRPARQRSSSGSSCSSSSSSGSDREERRKLQVPGGAPAGGKPGGGPQDKIIALAMAQAGKLFDQKGGGDKQGKTQAMQSAGTTAMHMMSEYKSTGKMNLQGGEVQKLMGVAMSLF